ncbi:hypothetical protein RRG08_014457 [Elysia crispata]|uniref:Reverse transcriptase RNase H-like domain-containing protein n=1 Tax=Elysia crispata TaxID=231223 RepID=A0AAE1CYG5_9GAST|nr:hypothetical protein RRG08_014457 [Elysia crispata]
MPLYTNKTFPLPSAVKEAFDILKEEIAKALVVSIDPTQTLVVETDASDVAVSATLNQCGKPVAFFSRTLNHSERNHSSIEKEACAIVEALRNWRHYLSNKHFKLVTDQKSVSFMFDNAQKGKIKNDKIQRWRIEISNYSYDVVYRPGSENAAADALSRATCSATTSGSMDNLKEIQDSLCHPGITRMCHFVKSRNLPYSVQEVKQIVANSINETPHERLFRYNRKSTTGTTLPQWLSSPGPVLLKRNVRASKYEPLVDTVELLDCNPLYDHVKLPDGKETTVSLHQLAPIAGENEGIDVLNTPSTIQQPSMSEDSVPVSVDIQQITDQAQAQVNHSVKESNDPLEHFADTGNLLQETVSKQSSELLSDNKDTRHTPFIRTRAYNLRSREA